MGFHRNIDVRSAIFQTFLANFERFFLITPSILFNSAFLTFRNVFLVEEVYRFSVLSWSVLPTMISVLGIFSATPGSNPVGLPKVLPRERK
jgi:hypothetical protein